MKFRSSLPHFTFSWGGALALFLGAFIPAMGFSFGMELYHKIFDKSLLSNNYALIITNLLVWVGAIWAFDFFICRSQTGKKLNFDLSGENFYTYLLIFPMMFGMMLIAEFITSKIPITGPFFGEMYRIFSELMENLSNDTSIMILLAVFMAPIFEEIVFRGIIQKGLINKGMNPQKAIWSAAIIFGLVHGNPWQFVGAVLLGYVLGIVYFKTKSLLLPILLHAFNNLISTLLIYYSGTESFSDAFGVSEYVILGAGTVLFSLFYFFFMKKYRVHYAEN